MMPTKQFCLAGVPASHNDRRDNAKCSLNTLSNLERDEFSFWCQIILQPADPFHNANPFQPSLYAGGSAIEPIKCSTALLSNFRETIFDDKCTQIFEGPAMLENPGCNQCLVMTGLIRNRSPTPISFLKLLHRDILR
jgi:hypothetical protein